MDEPKGRVVLAIDFDGTLTLEPGGMHNPNPSIMNAFPDQKVINQVNRDFDAGHFIMIWTARRDEDKGEISGWLDKHGVKRDIIITGKPRVFRMVDDRAILPSEYAAHGIEA